MSVCVDCGDHEVSTDGRCRECDIEHALEETRCQLCGVALWNDLGRAFFGLADSAHDGAQLCPWMAL
jgi:hypothetical protein